MEIYNPENVGQSKYNLWLIISTSISDKNIKIKLYQLHNLDSLVSVIPGCTSLDALNYNPSATINDGSCEYPDTGMIEGCTDPLATNFNPEANVDDGSCVIPLPELSNTYPLGEISDILMTNVDNQNISLFNLLNETIQLGNTTTISVSCNNFNYISIYFSSTLMGFDCQQELLSSSVINEHNFNFQFTNDSSEHNGTNIMFIPPGIDMTFVVHIVCKQEPNESITMPDAITYQISDQGENQPSTEGLINDILVNLVAPGEDLGLNIEYSSLEIINYRTDNTYELQNGTLHYKYAFFYELKIGVTGDQRDDFLEYLTPDLLSCDPIGLVQTGSDPQTYTGIRSIGKHHIENILMTPYVAGSNYNEKAWTRTGRMELIYELRFVHTLTENEQMGSGEPVTVYTFIADKIDVPISAKIYSNDWSFPDMPVWKMEHDGARNYDENGFSPDSQVYFIKSASHLVLNWPLAKNDPLYYSVENMWESLEDTMTTWGHALQGYNILENPDNPAYHTAVIIREFYQNAHIRNNHSYTNHNEILIHINFRKPGTEENKTISFDEATANQTGNQGYYVPMSFVNTTRVYQGILGNLAYGHSTSSIVYIPSSISEIPASSQVDFFNIDPLSIRNQFILVDNTSYTALINSYGEAEPSIWPLLNRNLSSLDYIDVYFEYRYLLAIKLYLTEGTTSWSDNIGGNPGSDHILIGNTESNNITLDNGFSSNQVANHKSLPSIEYFWDNSYFDNNVVVLIYYFFQQGLAGVFGPVSFDPIDMASSYNEGWFFKMYMIWRIYTIATKINSNLIIPSTQGYGQPGGFDENEDDFNVKYVTGEHIQTIIDYMEENDLSSMI